MANSALEAAVEMAAAAIKDGAEPRSAFWHAARMWGLTVSEVARAAGERGGKAAGKQKRQERAQREAAEAFDFIKSS